jgi:hypothetical protein
LFNGLIIKQLPISQLTCLTLTLRDLKVGKETEGVLKEDESIIENLFAVGRMAISQKKIQATWAA